MATQIRTTKSSDSGSGGTSVKTTTYETTRSFTEEPVYRPKLTQRSLVIQRGGTMPSNSMSMMRSSQSFGMNVNPGAYQAVSAIGVANVKTTRDREKKDMQDLNERFASYIERVRFLEAQNRKLADELDKLKSKWGKETTAIKAMYQAELDEARRLLDDAEKEKARLQIRCSTIEQELEELREKLDDARNCIADQNEKIQKQNETLSSYESEINLLQRRVESLENDREKDKKEIARLQEALNRARVDLDNETLAHIDAENRRQTLEEELEFLKQVHDQEMKELAALAYRDTTNENREFWKSEMAQAMRDIQVAYDEKLDTMRGELETYYNMKVQEFRTGAAKNNMESVHAKEETKRLRGQLTDMRAKLADLEGRNVLLERELAELRREYDERSREWEMEKTDLNDQLLKRNAELEAILKELQDLMDSKLGLELEIAAYRKLLEGEENNIGLRQVVEQIIAQQDRSDEQLKMTVTEMANRNVSTTSKSVSVTSKSVEVTKDANLRQMVTDIAKTQADSNLRVSQVVKGEMSAKTTYQRSAKGPVSIAECSADGKYIIVENTGRKEENMSGWQIKRIVDGAERASYSFQSGFTLTPNRRVKIFAGPGAGPSDLAAPQLSSWGIGANITTKLVNPSNEDRATHVQKTIYTS